MSERTYSFFSSLIDFKIDSVDDVKKAIILILLTNKNERLMRNDMGVQIRKLTFSPMESINDEMLKNDLTKTIERMLPVVKMESIKLDKDIENSILNISLDFKLKTIDKEGNLNINIPWQI